MLWSPDVPQYHFEASLQTIKHITFEGIIRLTPIRAALRLLPNLRSVKFEACHPSFTQGNYLQYCNLATSSIFDPESSKDGGQEPKYPRGLAVKVANLLTEEYPTGQELPCRSTLQRLELSGLTFTDSDIQSLLELLMFHEKHQKHRGTATPYSGRFKLTLKACFYTAINDNGGGSSGEDANDLGHRCKRVPVRDAESMGYNEAEELFKHLPEQFEIHVEEKEGDEDVEDDEMDDETNSEGEDLPSFIP
jgi:hypothetical protein